MIRVTRPPYVKAGGRVVYRTAALEQWLRDRERTSTSDRGPHEPGRREGRSHEAQIA